MRAFQARRAYVLAILAIIAAVTVVFLVLISPRDIEPSPASVAGIWGSWAIGTTITLFLLVVAATEIGNQRLILSAMGALGSTLYATVVIIFRFLES